MTVVPVAPSTLVSPGTLVVPGGMISTVSPVVAEGYVVLTLPTTSPDVGDLLTLTARFYSDAALSILADPTSVSFEIRDPDGVVLTVTPTPFSVGVYTYDWVPLVRGVHEIRVIGTGVLQVVELYGMDVRGGFPATTDLVDLQTVRAFMRMPPAEDDQDPLLEGLIATASAHLIETYEHEWVPSGSAPATRAFTYSGGGIIDLSPWNAQAGTISAVSLTPDGGTAVDLTLGTGWVEMPAQNRYGVTNYLRLAPTGAWFYADPRVATVTATWGYPAVPEAVKQAACWTVAHWHRSYVGSRPSGFSEPDEGALEYRVAIPQMARWLLRPFERLVVA